MPNAPKDSSEISCTTFESPIEFRRWLYENADRSDGIWLRFLKKDAAEKSITYAEALDEALCYGWIDAQKIRLAESSPPSVVPYIKFPNVMGTTNRAGAGAWFEDLRFWLQGRQVVVMIEKCGDINGKPCVGLRPEAHFISHDVLGLKFWDCQIE